METTCSPRFLLAATISLAFCLPCVGQEIPFGAIVESPFAAELDSIGELIELKVDDGQLGLFRRWDLKINRENVDETAESLLEAEIQRQLNRGMPEKHARRMAEMKAEGGLFGGMETEKSAAYAASNFMSRLHSNLDFADPKTLVRVLELANDEQRPFVVQQLRSVTGEKLTDLADWREHLSIEN